MTVLPSHSEEMYYSKDNVVIRVSCFFGEEFFLDLGWESLAPPFVLDKGLFQFKTKESLSFFLPYYIAC